MKPRLPLALIAAAITPSISLADVITQTVPFDYDGVSGIAFPVVQGFDTLGGARELRAVTFEFHHNFALDLYVESTGPTPIAAGDLSLSVGFISLFQLGEAGGKKDPPPPFFGPGAIFIDSASGDLGAYDGIPGNDGPDSYRRTFTDAFTVVQHYTPAEPDVLAAVTDVGPLTTILGGFTEMFFAWVNDPNWPPPPSGFPEYPDDAAVWANIPAVRHFGDIVITYDYEPVPGPATAPALLALGSLASARRRR